MNKKVALSDRIFVYFFALMYVVSAFMAKPTQMIILITVQTVRPWEKLSQASHAATLITFFLSIGLTCILEHTP